MFKFLGPLVLAAFCFNAMAAEKIKAFGPFHFGDSIIDVETALPNHRTTDLFGLSFTVSPNYRDQSLSEIYLISDSGKLSDYRDHVLWPAYKKIKNTFSEKYGNPAFDRDFSTLRFEVPEDGHISMAGWKNDERVVLIDLCHFKSRKFLLSISIIDPAAYKAMKKEEKQKATAQF